MFQYHIPCVIGGFNCILVCVYEFYTDVFASARICLGTTVKKNRGYG